MNYVPQIVNHHDLRSIDEAAKALDCSPNSLRKWLHLNPSIKDKYCLKAHYPNNLDGRIKTVISIEALPIIANMKNVSGKDRKSAVTEHFKEGKRKIAEKAIDGAKIEDTLSQMQQAITLLANEIQTLKGNPKNPLALTATTELPKEKSTRKLLNERLRKFAEENDLHYPVVWGKLYEEVYYRYSVNIRKRAKTRGISALDMLEEQGLMEEAFKIACYVFRLSSDSVKQ